MGAVSLNLATSVSRRGPPSEVRSALALQEERDEAFEALFFTESPLSRAPDELRASSAQFLGLVERYGVVRFSAVSPRSAGGALLELCRAELETFREVCESLGASGLSPRRVAVATRDVAQTIARRGRCPICYEKKSLSRLLRCGHAFCRKCAGRLTLKCPMCRDENSTRWIRAGTCKKWFEYVESLRERADGPVALLGEREVVATARAAVGASRGNVVFLHPASSERQFSAARAAARLVALDGFGRRAARVLAAVWGVKRVEFLRSKKTVVA
jgi:hypothetical protein